MKRYSEIGHIGGNPRSTIRRRLLLAAPLGSAASLVPAIALAHSTSHVGVLLPGNERIPGLRLDWRTGFQTELLAAHASFQPHFVEYAVGPQRALQAAQSLLDHGCTTLTGIFSRNLADHLRDSLAQHSARFFVSDLGANAVRRSETCSNLSRVGPNLWQQAYIVGQHYAATGARRALVATSFYEAGYDLPGAFQAGFVAAGGEHVAVVVTGTPEPTLLDDGFTRVSAAIARDRFDVLFSLYSGREAARYLPFAQRDGFNSRVGQMAALSTLVHGLPQSAALRAGALSMQIATAQSPGLGDPAETLYTTMGRVAAREVLACIDASCAAPAQWSLVLTSASDLAGSSAQRAAASRASPQLAAFGAAVATPWDTSRTTISSGWVAPYGA